MNPVFRRIAMWSAIGAQLCMAAPAHASTITLTAGSDIVNVGDVFDIPISVNNAAGLTSYQFDVGFDASIIEFQSVSDTSTDFAAAAISLTGLADFPQGSPVSYLSGVADSMFSLGAGLTPSGTIADIQFKALAAGVSPVTFSCSACTGAFLTDNGIPLSSTTDFSLQNGSVTVNGPASPVPEPATLMLVGTGLAVAARLRTRRSKLF